MAAKGDSASEDAGETTSPGHRWRLALVTTELEPGGAERCLTELALRLDRRQFDPLVISLAPPPKRTCLTESLAAARIPVFFLGLRGWWRLPGAAWALRRHLMCERVDLVQSFLFHANVLTALAAPCPVVWGIRVADPRRVRHRWERLLARRTSAIICVSHDVQEFVRNRVRVPEKLLRVIPNAVAAEAFAPVSAGDLAPPGKPYVPYLLFVGRLDPQKGLDWLAESVEPLLARLPKHRLLVVGDGPWKGQFESRLPAGVRSRVELLGWQPDAWRWMRCADLLLLPSRWEGMPRVVLEAMAVGCPVLVSQVHGVAELLGEAMAQQSVPFGNTGEFVEKAVRLVEDQTLRARTIEQNRLRLHRYFSVEKMVSQYEALYREILVRRSHFRK
ncbi:MAG: hypothetical protein KatS3mg110_0914 [Pirellulaceae bacterium]|nr:MAG: hypothetical protein KatS3mg110_0914 [Pirellulaceae bacterium]